jgi:hypothetical protein
MIRCLGFRLSRFILGPAASVGDQALDADACLALPPSLLNIDYIDLATRYAPLHPIAGLLAGQNPEDIKRQPSFRRRSMQTGSGPSAAHLAEF